MTLPTPVGEFFDATNDGDLDRFLAAFDPDAVLDDWGSEFVGLDGIREWTEGQSIGVGQTFQVRSFHLRGGKVEVAVEVGGGGFNGPSTFTFKLTEHGHSILRATISA